MAKLQEMGEFVRSASSTIEAPVVRRLTEALGGPTKGSSDRGGNRTPRPPQAAPGRATARPETAPRGADLIPQAGTGPQAGTATGSRTGSSRGPRAAGRPAGRAPASAGAAAAGSAPAGSAAALSGSGAPFRGAPHRRRPSRGPRSQARPTPGSATRPRGSSRGGASGRPSLRWSRRSPFGPPGRCGRPRWRRCQARSASGPAWPAPR
ncbi:hypothetical protein ACFQX6_28635 [Streptosporangium lutulentum]